MLLWYAAGSIVAVCLVFQSAGLDYRLIAFGSLLPVADLIVEHQALAHTLLAPTGALMITMFATMGRGRRLLRRRLLGVPIGWFFGIGLSGGFTQQDLFWWPAFGNDFGNTGVFPSFGWAVALELIGATLSFWIWSRFALSDRGRRRDFLRTGRLVSA